MPSRLLIRQSPYHIVITWEENWVKRGDGSACRKQDKVKSATIHMEMAVKPEGTKVPNSKEDYELEIQLCILTLYDW